MHKKKLFNVASLNKHKMKRKQEINKDVCGLEKRPTTSSEKWMFDKVVLNDLLYPFFTPLDVCILRMTCKTIQLILKPKKGKKKRHCASFALEFGFFRLCVFMGQNSSLGNKIFLSKDVASTFKVYPNNSEQEQIAQDAIIHETFQKSQSFPTIGEFFFAAAQSGNLKVFKTYETHSSHWDEATISAAAESGNLELVKYLRQKGCRWTELTCSFAASNGHLEILQWARSEGCPWDEDTCTEAASKGHFEVLKWARKNGCPCPDDICSYASENGHFEILKWLKEQGCILNSKTLENIAATGNLEMVKWADRNQCPWSTEILYHAAKSGNAEMIHWILQNGKIVEIDRPTGNPCRGAASRGHVHILELLITLGYDITKSVSHAAAAHGHLNVLKWVKAKGFPFSEHCCFEAFSLDHMEIFTWLRENGCSCDPTTEKLAREKGYTGI